MISSNEGQIQETEESDYTYIYTHIYKTIIPKDPAVFKLKGFQQEIFQSIPFLRKGLSLGMNSVQHCLKMNLITQ